jgi:hypothetical protein
MNDPGTVTVFTVELPSPQLTKAEREYRAFRRLLPQLLKTHEGQFVAIHNETVVDCGDEEIGLAERVWDKVGYLPLHIGFVSEQALAPERIPHYRELPR